VDDEARARHDDDEAWRRFMGRRRDSRRGRWRRNLGFAWALLLGMFAVGVLVGLLVGRIGGGNQEEAASTRPPRTVTVEKTVPVETTVEKTVETTVEKTIPAATTATPTATATATAAPTTATTTPTTTPAAIQYQYGRTGVPPGTIDGGASSPIGEARR
jgi:cytoskeletal protein RodZ